jgi:IS5 family transposase
MLRTVGDQPTLWEAILPEELRRLPAELARVDVLLDDPAFFAPFTPFFDPRIGRPSTPMETYLRLMFLKFRYRLGFESLCREVSDSITWRQFCRIGIDQPVPHPTTLMKLTTRCGSVAVDGLNEALLAKAAEAKLLRCTRVRVDTTVVPSNIAYPTDAALLAKAVGRIAATGRRIRAAGGATRTRLRDRSRAAGSRAHAIASKLRSRAAAGRDEAMAAVKKANAELADLAEVAAAEAARLLANAKRALRKARTTAAQRKLDRRPDPVAGRRRGRLVRAVNDLEELLEATRGSRPRLGSGWPGSPRTGRPGGSACTTPTPGRSRRAGSASRSSSATKPKLLTTTTVSSSTTTCSPATPPTLHGWSRRSSGWPGAPAATRAPWPRTAATAKLVSTTPCTTSASATSSSPAKADLPKPGKQRNTGGHSGGT